MEKEIIEKEMQFLLKLKDLSSQYLLEASLKSKDFPEGFDIAKAIQVLYRAVDAEIEYLVDNPEDYMEIYN